MRWLSVLLCLIWGFNFVIMKLGNGAFPPVQFAALRFLTGTIVLFGIMLWKKSFLPRKGEMKWFLLCGILQTMYFNIAIQISLVYINAGLTSVLTYSMPLFLSILAHYFIPGESLHKWKLLGVCIGVAGLFVAMDIHLDGNLWAMLLGLSSAVSWAIANLIIKKKLQHTDKLQFTSWQMLFGTIGLFLYSFIIEDGQAHFTLTSISYILFSGILASALAFLLWSHILSTTEASKASIMLLLVPIVGIISGWLFLHEQLKLITVVGISLVLTGIWIVNVSGRFTPIK